MLKVQPNIEGSLRRDVDFQSHGLKTLEHMVSLVFKMLLKGQTLDLDALRL